MFEVTGDAARINRDWRRDRTAFAPLETGALRALRDLVAECRFDVPEGLPKALATLVGFFAYETIGLVERIPRAPGAGLARTGVEKGKSVSVLLNLGGRRTITNNKQKHTRNT